MLSTVLSQECSQKTLNGEHERINSKSLFEDDAICDASLKWISASESSEMIDWI